MATVDRMTPTDGRALLLGRVTERQWQDQVIAWARRAGWRVYHSWSSIHSPSGFPDLCMVRGDRLIFAELKRIGGKTTSSQKAWLEDLRHAVPGVEVYVWTPADEVEVKVVLLGLTPAAVREVLGC